MSTYIDLLHHPYWQKKRLRILNRDDWTCRRCCDTQTMLQIHHLWYNIELKPWEYPDEALITLCDLCHKKAEFIKWLTRTGLYTLHELGFSNIDLIEIKEVVERRLEANKHRESAIRYMDNLKLLIHG